ncbi:MAG: hypothetical protein ACLP01_02030 [Solirubrobacteraceae bacterium]
MCARTGPRATIVRVSVGSPTRWTLSGSRGRCSRDPLLPKAFKRAGQDQGPDERHQLLAIWHNRCQSILKSRQHLVNEAESLLCELPLLLREQLPASKAVRPRLAALAARKPSPALRPANHTAPADAR